MSRKGFLWGLVAGMAIMGLLLVMGGAAIWALRWVRGASGLGLSLRSEQRALPFRWDRQGWFFGPGMHRLPVRSGVLGGGIARVALCGGSLFVLAVVVAAVAFWAIRHRRGHCCLHGDASAGSQSSEAAPTNSTAAGDTASEA